MSLVPGHRVGVYEIVGPLGSGGMGEVYRARDTRLGRLVAIKFVSDDLINDGSSAARLAREAELTSSLNHPNIVTVHDVGEVDGRPFIVMELIDGHSLFTAIESGPMKPARVVEIGCQIADGLAAAHGAGVVHRDLKPRNVMIADEGRVKIVDFGLGKVPVPQVSSDASTVQHLGLTQEHAIVGTAGYMSPEQVKGRAVDFRSDQFALGLILYEMLTGQRAFKRDTPLLTMAAVAEREPPLLADFAPDTPLELATIIDRCLAKDPADRYASTRDLARDLHDVRHTIAVSRSTSTVRRPLPKRNRRWVIAAGVVVVLGAIGAYALRDRSNPVRDARVLLDRYDKAENVDRAIALLEPAVTARPADPVRQTLLAEAYWRRYETTRDKTLIARAANAAGASLKLNQNYAPTHVVLAIFNNGQSRFDGASGEALLAIKLDARSSGAWRELGRAYLGLGNQAEAGQAFLKAVEFGPDDWTAHNNLGGFYFRTGRLDDAALSFERVLALAPDNVRAYNNLGSVHLRRDRAQEMYERSLSIERNPTALSNLARAYYEQGLFADAARTFESAVAMPGPTYQLWANLGAACYFAPGLRDRARVAYETAIKLGEEARDVTPKDAGVLAALADAHAVLALLSDAAGAATHAAFARSLLAAIERLKPSGADVLFTIASTHEELGDRPQALEWLAKAASAGYPMNSVRRSPWLKALRDDPAYMKQFPQR
jgi:serine/threonine protein kinase/tetratricopeptide (TPR) repeat protein